MKKGFTVLELLLVITIIMLIASMSLQSYYQAKKQAEAVRCKTYRKQMETVQSMPEFDYTTKYGEFSKYSSVVDEMVFMYNECFRCHPSVTNNEWQK
jgi:Tfp pilus assembly protein PilE|tara:strand:+ start:28 stop:318 length:291 start_codon:yes stop_codon:yes gene_type:complete